MIFQMVLDREEWYPWMSLLVLNFNLFFKKNFYLKNYSFTGSCKIVQESSEHFVHYLLAITCSMHIRWWSLAFLLFYYKSFLAWRNGSVGKGFAVQNRIWVWILNTNVKSQRRWLPPLMPALKGRDKRILGSHLPVSVDDQWASGLVRDPVPTLRSSGPHLFIHYWGASASWMLGYRDAPPCPVCSLSWQHPSFFLFVFCFFIVLFIKI